MTALERFMAKVAPATDGSDCLLWIGATDGKGYGLFQVASRRSVRAYRWYWEHLHGPVPEGRHLDHLCRNHACVNDEHLEPVTQRENILRGMAPAAINARKTSCIRGHAFVRDDRGHRRCPTCEAAAKRRHKAKRRAARLHALTGGQPRRCQGPNCTTVIAAGKRIGTLYCSPRCRVDAFYAKQTEAAA